MKILYDLLCAQPAVGSKYHGGGEYAKTVFEKLSTFSENDLIVFFDKSKYMDEWILDLIEKESVRVYNIQEYVSISEIFEHENIEVFYSALPYFDTKSIVPEYVLTIGTFHGLRLIEKPTDLIERYYVTGIYRSLKSIVKPCISIFLTKKWINKYRAFMRGFDEIVCVSEHTKYSIKNYFPELEINPSVFYTPNKFVDNCRIGDALVEGKYILMLGCNRWEKNGYRNILAIENLKRQGQLLEYKIVTVGKIPPRISKIINGKDYYIQFGYVPAEDLENLYYFCDLFLFTSLNEGFGMPPLEAMKYGKTCIVSGVCSLPEVCGDAVYYCNPYDVQEIQNRLIMGSEKKIKADHVLNQVKKIRQRQDADLDKLCYLIMNKE